MLPDRDRVQPLVTKQWKPRSVTASVDLTSGREMVYSRDFSGRRPVRFSNRSVGPCAEEDHPEIVSELVDLVLGQWDHSE